jgi:hypothetical protein
MPGIAQDAGAFNPPPTQRPMMGITRTAESSATGSRTVSLRIDDAPVHQCQQRASPVIGRRTWRPARTLRPDPPPS